MYFDAVVAGAGVVGLCVARELAISGMSVVVLERNPWVGSETSSRNSEVIHSGIYYPTGSNKHLHCVNGRDQLYEYLRERDIRFHRCGKLIVATSSQEISRLQDIYKTGVANGLVDLTLLESDQVSALEPEVSCRGGILVNETGVFDSHSFLQSLCFDIEEAGGIVVCNHRVEKVSYGGSRISIAVSGLGDEVIKTKRFINSAGLGALELMARCEFNATDKRYRYEFAKGNYVSLSGGSPFSRLIYPIPEQGGLGVHSTLDISGRTKFGPNVEWLNTAYEDLHNNYAVKPDLVDEFVPVIRKYWKAVDATKLQPDYSGIRPKLFVDDQAIHDFEICTQLLDGCVVINLLGIESPGLTSGLSLGHTVKTYL